MTGAARQALVAQLVQHEGLRLKPYTDTVGKLTIGVGRNLSDRGITEAEAMAMLDADIDLSVRELTESFGWFAGLDPVRQRVLIDMHVNLGLWRLRRFSLMLAAVARGDYQTAAQEMLNSKWRQQVKGRAVRLAQMMRDGDDPDTERVA